MLSTTGSVQGITNPVIRKVCVTTEKADVKDVYHLTQSPNSRGVISLRNYSVDELVCFDTNTLSIEDGDILLVEPNGLITKVYDTTSTMNSLFLTEECNCRCITCPQPPVKNDTMPWGSFALKIVNLISDDPLWLGITGGEPTIKWDELISSLVSCSNHLPETSIQLLSNGITFSDYKKAYELKCSHEKIIVGIPLFSDVDELHNKSVGVRGAFWDTISGIHNLERLDIPIELRIVISKMNYTRLPQLAEFIYKHLPFVQYVAFMGLEPIGNAQKHIDTLWIPPKRYFEKLQNAVHLLHQRDVKSILFNLPLCNVPDSLHSISKKAITEWKVNYYSQCDDCDLKHNCGGVFQSAKPYMEKYIEALKL
jgi:His-Xaa-Ser system radical SAM maturase HxsC